MDDFENIFANLKLNSENASDSEECEKYFEQIDIALKKNETTSKWIDDIEEECGPISIDEYNKLFDILQEVHRKIFQPLSDIRSSRS